MESRKPMRMVHLPTDTLAGRRRYDAFHYTGREGSGLLFSALPRDPLHVQISPPDSTGNLRPSPQEYGLTVGRIQLYKIAASPYSCAGLLTRLEPRSSASRRARVAELADARDLGSRGQPWGFKSPLSHHTLFRQWANNCAGHEARNE